MFPDLRHHFFPIGHGPATMLEIALQILVWLCGRLHDTIQGHEGQNGEISHLIGHDVGSLAYVQKFIVKGKFGLTETFNRETQPQNPRVADAGSRCCNRT